MLFRSIDEANNNLPDNITCVICGVTRPKSELCANNYKCRVCGSDVRLTLEENLKRDKGYQPNNKVSENAHPKAIKCPYCNSTNITKISITKRSLSTYLFGLGSGKVGKQWHCNDCKSDF